MTDIADMTDTPETIGSPETAGPCRLYLITPPVIPDLDAFAVIFANAFDGGDIACVQLRLKTGDQPASDDIICRAAERLAPIAKDADAAFLINDRPDLARATGVDGVHIGQNDIGYAGAREILGADAIIGVTCHDSRHLSIEAGEAGADYVAFGAFYPTETKAAPTRAPVTLLEWWRHATTIPCVAIGGIAPGNAAPLVTAGADFLAVSSAIWQNPDGPAAAVAAFHQVFAEAAGPAPLA